MTFSQVRRYHEENYRPENTLLLLSGLADEEDFRSALAQIESRVQSKGALEGAQRRPWSGPTCAMAASGVEGVLSSGGGTPLKVLFPSDDETTGCVSMAWRGPRFDSVAGGPQAAAAAWLELRLLWRYLTEDASSPLQKVFVECDEPLCGDLGAVDEVHQEGSRS